ncbi:conserved hypothetical protein [Bosea sp. EC-HK365B]|nr:conserved hypothetical protein [Bosea sp. 21B]CAD5292413.1 conserved hypothetical protein [Bosea sp. 46]CAD5300172.1 conserved hypothetical protein [Bosea sp. 7B]VVT57243.1 conserved hypothetical protein [Bosea sp. EC-HK365B]VXB51617.1 conserved hypothetical protein [Bosea sp. 127]VXC68259.1 conserved hypothetical protein [Bosea sp. 29B]VXC86462.1 conserved hypothetical protein [Bosea sp. 125]
MSTPSVDQTKTPEHATPDASSCCGGHANTEASEKAHGHASCATHDRTADHAITAVSPDDQGRAPSSAGRPAKKSSCCSGG